MCDTRPFRGRGRAAYAVSRLCGVRRGAAPARGRGAGVECCTMFHNVPPGTTALRGLRLRGGHGEEARG